MPLALARSVDANAAHLAIPGAVVGGWYRLRRPRGRVLVWAVRDLPAIGLVSAWPSRQQADACEFSRATILPAAEFAATAVLVEATDG